MTLLTMGLNLCDEVVNFVVHINSRARPQDALGAWLMQVSWFQQTPIIYLHVVAAQQTVQRSSQNILLEITTLTVCHMTFNTWSTILEVTVGVLA